MTDYEYTARLVTADGQIADELSEPRRKPLTWAPGLAAAILRSRGHDVTAVQLRRPAGSDDEWQPYEPDRREELLAERTNRDERRPQP